jgi:PAS domain S-box-containing protein
MSIAQNETQMQQFLDNITLKKKIQESPMSSMLDELLTFSKDMKVLYVEDDVALRQELQVLLSDIFSLVCVAKDGQEGIEKLKNMEFDIVITDIRMPVMNGITMIQNLKKAYPRLPIIVLSAHNEIEYLLELINLGIQHFITKPLRSEQLFEVLHKVSMVLYHEKELVLYKEELEVANKKLEKLVNIQSKNINFKTSMLNSYRKAIYEVALVSVTDKNGCIKDVNKNFCDKMGYTKEELLGKKHSIFKHPDTDENIYNEIWEKISAKKIWHGIIINQTKTFEPCYHYTTIIPILDDKDEIYEYLSIKQDLTQFEELNKEKLAKSVETSKLVKEDDILKKIPFATVLIDKKGNIKHFNKFFEEYISELEDMEHYASLFSNSLNMKDFLQTNSFVQLDDIDFTQILCDANKTVTIIATIQLTQGEKKLYIRIKQIDVNMFICCFLCKEELETCFLAFEN